MELKEIRQEDNDFKQWQYNILEYQLKKIIYTFIENDSLRNTIIDYFDLSTIENLVLPKPNHRTEADEIFFEKLKMYSDIITILFDAYTLNSVGSDKPVAFDVIIPEFSRLSTGEQRAKLVSIHKELDITKEQYSENDIQILFGGYAYTNEKDEKFSKKYRKLEQNNNGSFSVKIQETAIVQELSKKYKYVDGQFYSVNGIEKESDIKRRIYKLIVPYFDINVDRKVNSLYESLKLCEIDGDNAIKVNENEINVANGTIYADDKNKFTLFVRNDKHFCFNRIQTTYRKDAKEPVKFLKYFNELIPKNAQRTVKQYLGYCLIQSTKVQKTLVLIGDGGEGKSVLGEVMLYIFGEQNAIKSSITNYDINRFALANLENKLLCVDDDVTEHALINSSNFKTMVTNNGLIQAERKFQQATNIQLYAKFILCSNFPLASLYDTSEAFYRRLLNIRVLSKPKDRQDNKNLVDELKAEATSILKWLVDGLNDLIDNDFNLYVPSDIQAESDNIQRESDTVGLWLSEDNNLIFGYKDKYAEHTAVLFEHYKLWCNKNLVKPVTENGFSRKLSQKSRAYNIEKNKHVKSKTLPYQSESRGYRGIGIKRNLFNDM